MKRLLSIVLVILMGCFARLAKADEAPTCDVYVRACNTSLCKEIDVTCFFGSPESGVRRRFRIAIGWSMNDQHCDGLLGPVCDKIREEGDGYKNYDTEFKNFLLSIAAVHEGDNVYAISSEENAEIFNQLSTFLLS